MAAIMRRSAAALRMAGERARVAVATIIAEDKGAGGSAGSANMTLLRVANWLRFAATPIFVVMALLVGGVDEPLPGALR